MPLRAKITSPAFARPYSDTATSAETRPTDTPVAEPASPPSPDDSTTADDVLFNSLYGLRTIELNRPEKLNALNGSMIEQITQRLQEWEKSQLANVVVIKGAGRGFCAGGDVVTLARQNAAGRADESTRFFAAEYRLNHLIATYSKPYVALMDGPTMGGGIGLSVHAPFRIATERTVAAMPETKIGFFPDVGASFFLPRLDGLIGTYLALTSASLKGVQAYYAGFATHYLHSSVLSDLEARLAELVFPDSMSLDERWGIVNDTIEEFSTGLPPGEAPVLAGPLRAAIDRCFRNETVEDILDALGQEETLVDWASKAADTLRARSPTALRVTLRQLRTGRSWTIAEAFQREHVIASHFMRHPDFVEGVTKLLLPPAQGGKGKGSGEGSGEGSGGTAAEPDKPVWDPATLDLTPEQTAIDFLHPPDGSECLALLKPGAGTYADDYPHAHRFGLPRERAVRDLIARTPMAASAAVDWFVLQYRGKDGVRAKVRDVLARCTVTDANTGFAIWDRTD